MLKKFILLSIVFAIWLLVRYSAPVHHGCLFTALNVGQGDSLLLQTTDYQDILIDGGPDDRVIEELSRTLPPGDRDIELMVLTHPHADHVNGLVSVTERFTVHHVLLTGVGFHQIAYETWLGELKRDHVPLSYAQTGQRYQVGNGTLVIEWPVISLEHANIEHDNAANGGGVNDSSIAMKFSCDGSQAMLMGDASSEIEDRIVNSGANVQADLLKVGHHGSRFSTSADFLRAVRPVWAVISAGAGNRYGHPHPSTLLRLQQFGIRVLRTDLGGTIRLTTDGHGHWTHK